MQTDRQMPSKLYTTPLSGWSIVIITRNSSGDEIANVNFLTTTSCTYYKIQ